MRIRTIKKDWLYGVCFQIQEGNTFVEKLTFKKFNMGESTPDTGTMKIEEAQVLMDDLWACGTRPTEGSGSAGSLKAAESHLEDLRKVAFAKDNDKPYLDKLISLFCDQVDYLKRENSKDSDGMADSMRIINQLESQGRAVARQLEETRGDAREHQRLLRLREIEQSKLVQTIGRLERKLKKLYGKRK